ncbi:DUF4870 family protein [Onishia niordana]|uniref:DUF4870 family protein n=1 Tax=Onishia niordana TaxID=2508711 RepID=UPI00109F0B5E|nr:DUF4870 domain-containing protein [Halomonas niordiana]
MSQTYLPEQDTRVTQIIYVLYLAGLITGSVTTLIGAIMAYVYRSDASPWLQEHYRYLIRTFWIGVLYSIAAFMLGVIGIGFLVMPLLALWLIVRCVIGLKAARADQPPAKPDTWLW